MFEAFASDFRLLLAKETLRYSTLRSTAKLRGCDLVSLKVSDLVSASGARTRVMILQRKTGWPVQFEVTEQTRRSVASWIERKGLGAAD
jgi:hypothetical protein